MSFEEQIISVDKYPSIFSPQLEAIMFIIVQMFFATRAVLKIGEYSSIFLSFSWGIFGHVTCRSLRDKAVPSIKSLWYPA